jgi:F-type H+-transporting ATPase subunit c
LEEFNMPEAAYSGLALVLAFGQIAAAFAVFTAFTTTFGQGRIVAHAVDAIARQPESRGNITTTMFIGLAIAETGGIYGLLVAIILLFVNPLGTAYMTLLGL